MTDPSGTIGTTAPAASSPSGAATPETVHSAIPMIPERYSRQAMYKGIGAAGQERLAHSRVAIVGMGALGTVIADNLCRAGVGFIRLVDRDYVELNNLQRQTLYDEEDARQGLPKVEAAAARLRRLNSGIKIEPVSADLNPAIAEGLTGNVDLVLDGTDNLETRLILNDACLKRGIPWIYGGAIMDSGMSMNIIPGRSPCFRCLVPELPPPGTQATCSTAGVLSMITGIIGCVQSAEALKILTGSPDVRAGLFTFDVWSGRADIVSIPTRPDCPACAAGRYEYLDASSASCTTNLCGRDAVQVMPAHPVEVDFAAIAARLAPLGRVESNRFILSFRTETLEIRLFRDGRAIIKNVRDANAAKSVYSEYIGF